MLRSFLARYLILPMALVLTGFAPSGHAQQAAATHGAQLKSAPTASASFSCWTYYGSYRRYATAHRVARSLRRQGYFTQVVLSACGCYYQVYYTCG
jgi:hypothetical protein